MTRPAPKHTDESTLEALVRTLTAAVQELATAFKKKTTRDRVIYGALALVVAAMAVLISLYYFVDLPNRRADNKRDQQTQHQQTQDQIRDLACYAVRLRPPGFSDTSDALRSKYRCPPFDPSDLPSGSPTAAPKPGPTVSRTVAGPRATVTRSAPAGGSTRTVTAPGAPAPTVTRTRTVAGPTRTTVRTVRVTATVTRGICLPIVC